MLKGGEARNKYKQKSPRVATTIFMGWGKQIVEYICYDIIFCTISMINIDIWYLFNLGIFCFTIAEHNFNKPDTGCL